MAVNAIAQHLNDSTTFANVASVIESYGAGTNLMKGKTKKKRGTTNDHRDPIKKSSKDRHDGSNHVESIGSSRIQRRKHSSRPTEENIRSQLKVKNNTISPTSSASKSQRRRHISMKTRKSSQGGVDISNITFNKDKVPLLQQYDITVHQNNKNEILVLETSIQANSPKHDDLIQFSKTNPNSFVQKKSSLTNFVALKSVANEQSENGSTKEIQRPEYPVNMASGQALTQFEIDEEVTGSNSRISRDSLSQAETKNARN